MSQPLLIKVESIRNLIKGLRSTDFVDLQCLKGSDDDSCLVEIMITALREISTGKQANGFDYTSKDLKRIAQTTLDDIKETL